MPAFEDELRRRLEGLCDLYPAQVESLRLHYELLVRWNRTLNLTSLQKCSDIVERHYCESLFLGARLPFGAGTLADLGSGGGFPGVPVAVIHPECQVTLIESRQRKAVFLRKASRHIQNIKISNARSEDVQSRFDWVITRAVSLVLLEKNLQRLAPSLAVLGGESPPLECAHLEWQTPELLPWGNRRFLWMGTFHVEHP